MVRKITLKIDKTLSGRRIESILKHEAMLSKTLIKRLKMTENSLLLNGRAEILKAIVKEGDVIEAFITEKSSTELEKSHIKVNVLYEDEDIIVVDKPYNMPTHPSKGHEKDTLLNALLNYFQGEVNPHIITRLDRETSGVVLVAKNALSARLLTHSMVNKEIVKEYEAIVVGVPDFKEGVITAPIGRKEGVLREVDEKGKEAETRYKVLNVEGPFSHMWLYPVTGRTHQIRVHMKHIGTPIYGDSLYGEKIEGERCHLHARRLKFTHPVTKEPMAIEAELPFSWKVENNVEIKKDK